ncbi:MAG: tRNA (N(6)-L-threonylcarbamoyladenosine(37)-C(2))-methylthiotransferase MtaB [Bacteroidota bacterium]
MKGSYVQGKVAFYTLGCKLNFSETSTIGKQFLSKGYKIVEFNDPADVYVINTCSVTEGAEKECRQIVRRALRKNPLAFIAVTGCYAQLRSEEVASIDGVDVVLGNNEKMDLFRYTSDFRKNELSCIYVSPSDQLNVLNPAASTDADSRTRAFLKIQDGCDYKCTYCTIPLARGNSRSFDEESIYSDFSRLVQQGYKEIVLTGVNIGDYGKRIGSSFYKLLLRLTSLPGDYRIRISSIEPNLLTDDILELTRESEHMCSHFHVPLQSGSNKILKLMKRRYLREVYEELCCKIKSTIPDAGIGVDVIVGFPGETQDDFEDTYNFIASLPVSYLHVFTYSERPDTPAINMPGSVDVVERKNRNNRLRHLSEKKRAEFYSAMVNKDLEILFENQNHDGMMKGFASNYVRVELPYDQSLVNSISRVKILSSGREICTGERV